MDGVDRLYSEVLPPLMHDPVTFAVPFFLLLLVIEWAAARKLAHTEAQRAPAGGRSASMCASLRAAVHSMIRNRMKNGTAYMTGSCMSGGSTSENAFARSTTTPPRRV